MGRKKKTDELTDQSPADLSSLDLIKGKLKAKFFLLKDEPLDQEDLESLKNHVCMVLGMDRGKLDWLLQDL